MSLQPANYVNDLEFLKTNRFEDLSLVHYSSSFNFFIHSTGTCYFRLSVTCGRLDAVSVILRNLSSIDMRRKPEQVISKRLVAPGF